MVYFPSLSRQAWPHDPGELDAFYGNPRGIGGANPAWERDNLVTFTYPWHEKGAQSYKIHKKVKPSLDRVLAAIWDYVGRDQTKITFYHLDETGGTYAYRANRNNPNALSNHSRGIAIDLAPDENPNRAAWVDRAPPHLPRFVVEAFKQEGWRWGGDFSGTKDAMHFEAVWDMHHDQAPVPAPKSTDAPAPIAPATPAPSPALPPALSPLLGLGEEAAALLVRQILSSSPAAVTEIASIHARLTGARDVINVALSLLDKVSLPAPSAPPVVHELPDVLGWLRQPGAPVIAPAPRPVNVQTGITATMFGGSKDRNTSAYDGHVITDSEPGCSLPFHFPRPVPMISIKGPNGATVTVPLVDVGPWNTNDPYWTKGARPQAESGTDMHGRHTNLAGIDLTPATAKALGIGGKGKVDWWIATGDQPSTGANIVSMQTDGTANVQVKSPMASKVNWTALAIAATNIIAVISKGKITLDPDQLVNIIGIIGPFAVIAFKTFGTATVHPQSIPSIPK